MKKFLSFLLILPMLISCSEDEVDLYGDIYGKIINTETGSPISGAEVTLSPGNSTKITGEDGLYEFIDLEAGQYSLAVKANDYVYNTRMVEVFAGERVSCDILMTKKSEIQDLGIEPQLLDFGTVLTEKSLTITNYGSTPTDWSLNLGNNNSWLSADPKMGTIAGGKKQTITFSIDRSIVTAEKNVTAQLLAFGNSYPINIVCNHESTEGKLQVSKTSLDFGDDLETVTFTLANIGNAPIDWIIKGLPAYLSVSASSGTLSSGGTKIISVMLDRSATTENVNTAIVVSDGKNETSISVTAQKSEGKLQVSKTSLDFGDDLETVTFTLANIGNAPIDWIIKGLPAYLSVSASSGTLSSGGTKIISVMLDRSATTENVNTAIVVSDGKNETSISVTAQKSEGKLQISKSTFDFGSDVNEITFSISNIGNGSLVWSFKNLPTYINISESTGTLASGATKFLIARINRDAISADVNKMAIISDGKNELPINIIATKVQKWAEMVISPKSISFGELSTSRTFTIENVGNETLSWTIEGDTPSALTVTPRYGTVAPNSSQMVTVNLNRDNISTLFNASIYVSDGSNTQTVSVTATKPIVEDYSTATIQSCDYRVEATIVSCKRNADQVTFKYKLKNIGLGDVRDFRIYPPSSHSLISGGYLSVITDNLDNMYPYPAMKFSTKSVASSSWQGVLSSEFYEGIPYPGEVTITGVPESATNITVMLGVFVYNHSTDITSRKIYFKNVPIY